MEPLKEPITLIFCLLKIHVLDAIITQSNNGSINQITSAQIKYIFTSQYLYALYCSLDCVSSALFCIISTNDNFETANLIMRCIHLSYKSSVIQTHTRCSLRLLPPLKVYIHPSDCTRFPHIYRHTWHHLTWSCFLPTQTFSEVKPPPPIRHPTATSSAINLLQPSSNPSKAPPAHNSSLHGEARELVSYYQGHGGNSEI